MSINNIFLRSLRLTVCGAMLFATACTDKFEEYNTNQHQATEEMMSQDGLKTGAFFSQMQRNVVLFQYGSGDEGTLSSDYQVAQGLTSDLYSGYIAPTGEWSRPHTAMYSFTPGWIEQTFTRGFSQVMPAWQEATKNAIEQDLPEVAALATVVKVEAMHRVADAYGPIPYCNFGSGTLQNNYDGLDEVYAKFFKELDEAIDVLTDFVSGNPSASLLAKYDYIYGGNAERWVKFANTLRLRLALRCVYVNPTLAQTEAEKSINNVYGVIQTKNERAALQHSLLDYYHPYVDIKDFNAGEARMSAPMEVYMNGYNDPRRMVLFLPTGTGTYKGVRLGINSVQTTLVGTTVSQLNFNSSTEIVWMTAAESYFLRAEGALRGWAMGGTAQYFYEAGIAASFDENGVTGAASYITSTTAPTAYATVGVSTLAAAPSTVVVRWNGNPGTDFESNLERIIVQKWLAMYPDGPEGWAEFRRTGYPKQFLVITNSSNGAVPAGTYVRRIPYPQSEYNNNSAGVQTGTAKLGGADNGGTKLWWDAKL
jgi:hypothetical protein